MIIISRIARKDLNTPFLHVMVQGVNKEYIFKKDEYIESYLDIINRNKEKFDFTMMAYCIMSNHAHFLMYAEDINEIGKFMHKVNLLYSNMYNREEDRCGVLFRNRYRAEPIYDVKYLANCIKYIHDNPVKAKMVLRCEDYKYSSYKDYMNNSGVTQSEIMKQIFGEKCDYSVLFKQVFEKRFIDVEEDENKNVEEYILGGVREFEKEYAKSIVDILSDRDTMKKLISFLKNNCGMNYVEIQEFFEIPRKAMVNLKKD